LLVDNWVGIIKMKLKLTVIFLVLTLFASFAYADSAVQIKPKPAYDNSTLHCVVNAGGDGYIYIWYKNSQLTAISGAYVNASYTHAGESWKCVVKKFYPAIGWATIGEDSAYINPSQNQPPVVNITSPRNGKSFSENSTITFSGTAIDPEDGKITNGSIFEWSSNITGIFAYGKNVNYSSLPLGIHKITLKVKDSQNLTGKDSIIIKIIANVTNNAPVIKIIQPTDNRTFIENASISFVAEATDAEDGILTGDSIKWYDNGNNFVNGTAATAILALGNHNISVVAIDSEGASSTDTVSIRVIPTNTSNNPPAVQLIYPLNGSVFGFGNNIHFSATASDPEDGILSGNSIEWHSSIDGFISYGNDFVYSNLSNGTHIITVYAFDSGGLSDSKSVTITINPNTQLNNSIPNVSIITPLNGAIFLNGTPITFEGYAYDTEDGTNLSLLWYSSIDGNLSSSRLFTTSSLSVGIHTITFNATDSKGATGTASTTINISTRAPPLNNPPSIKIINPADNSNFTNGSYILFSCQATDAEDGVLTGNSIHWYSSIDGNFANGTDVLLNSLSAGIHNITAVATDSQNASSSARITISIVPTNRTNLAPTAVIIRPKSGSVFWNGTPVQFEGSAVDPEEGFISDVEWISSIDGLLSKNLIFTISNLSAGNHTITFIATDSQGAQGADSIIIYVNRTNYSNLPPTIKITSPANNSIFINGSYIIFNAEATDAEDGVLTGNSIKWYDNGNNFANGTAAWTNTLSVGIHNITATATDSNNNIAADSITLTIIPNNATNNAPFVNITAPHDGAVFLNGTNVIFVGDAYDPEDGILTGASLQWFDFFNGSQFMGNGNYFNSTLAIGNHTIVLYASDSQGAVSNDSITIQIVPQNATNQTNRTAPNVMIILPINGANFSINQTINFAGIAVDADGNNVTNLQWISSADGIIGNSLNFTRYLSEGTHNITFIATDSFGLQGFDYVTINVFNYSNNQTNHTNGTLFIDIISPTDGQKYLTNIIPIIINASDYSNVTYQIDGGAEIKYIMPISQIFANGNHTITAKIKWQNQTATDIVSFEVNYVPPEANPPVVRLFSPGDRAVVKTDYVDFKFNATDNTELGSCTLIIDENYVKTSAAVQGMNTINYNMPSGDHKWQVACTDIYNNIGYSETRRITIMTGNFTYYQPPIKPKVPEFRNELLISSVTYDDDVSPGDIVPIKIVLKNSGDFDLDDIKLSASVYELDAYAEAKLDIENGKEKTKTLHIEIPEDAQKGVYDIKISASNNKIARTIYRELTVT